MKVIMKHFIKYISLSALLLLLLSSCSGNISGTETPVPEPTVVPATAPPSAEPTPSPEPVPALPVEVQMVITEDNNDDTKVYIRTELPDRSIYEEGSPGFLMASDITADSSSYESWLREQSEEYPATEENLMRYGFNAIPSVEHNDSSFLSIIVDYYLYTGGAHGNITRHSYNYIPDGRRITDFTELLAEGKTTADAETEINRQMAANVAEVGEMYFIETLHFADLDSLPPFYIKNGEVIIFFQTYELAPYAAGIQEFRMPPEMFSLTP